MDDAACNENAMYENAHERNPRRLARDSPASELSSELSQPLSCRARRQLPTHSLARSHSHPSLPSLPPSLPPSSSRSPCNDRSSLTAASRRLPSRQRNTRKGTLRWSDRRVAVLSRDAVEFDRDHPLDFLDRSAVCKEKRLVGRVVGRRGERLFKGTSRCQL